MKDAVHEQYPSAYCQSWRVLAAISPMALTRVPGENGPPRVLRAGHPLPVSMPSPKLDDEENELRRHANEMPAIIGHRCVREEICVAVVKNVCTSSSSLETNVVVLSIEGQRSKVFAEHCGGQKSVKKMATTHEMSITTKF